MVLIVSRILVCSFIALSAIWIIEIPSFAFEIDCPKEEACERSESAIDRPDASSAALLIRRPELSLLSELSIARLFIIALACAFIAAMFVFIVKPILNPFWVRALGSSKFSQRPC